MESSFEKIMCREINEMSIGSPLGPTMVNILVNFYEQVLFAHIKMFLLNFYLRYAEPRSVCLIVRLALANFIKR